MTASTPCAVSAAQNTVDHECGNYRDGFDFMRDFAPNSIDHECAYYRDGFDSTHGFGFASNTIDYE